MKGSKIVGIIIFIILVLIIIAIGIIQKANGNLAYQNLTDVYVATGGGKEGFIADEEVVKILNNRFGLNVIHDTWSNGKLIKNSH